MPEDNSDPRRATRWPWLVLVAVVGLVLGIAYELNREPDPPAATTSADPPPAPTAAVPRVDPPDSATVPTSTSPEAPLLPGVRLRLRREDFPASGTVRVYLSLPEASRDAAPRPVRVVSQPDHRILELEAPLSRDRDVALLEVDPDYLQPGSYLVEVKTTERTHFPLRRYVVVVE